MGADRALESALDSVVTRSRASGVEVEVEKVLVESAEQARSLRFVSSPTIRVNGDDVALELRESSCGSEPCTDGCGDQIACRVWVYQGQEYTEPPPAMIAEAILGHVYGGAASVGARSPTSCPTTSPVSSRPSACCPSPSEQESCCEPTQRTVLRSIDGGGLRMSVSAPRRSEPLDAAVVWADFHDRLLAFIARRVPDRGSAEDILQDVMLRIHRHAAELERSAAVGAWVHRIARNAIADYYRRAAVRREWPSGIDLDRDGVADGRAHVGRASRRARRRAAPVAGAAARDSRRTLRLTEFKGLTQADAAARLGVSTSGMKSRVQRARPNSGSCSPCCQIELDRRGAITSYQPRRTPATAAAPRPG